MRGRERGRESVCVSGSGSGIEEREYECERLSVGGGVSRREKVCAGEMVCASVGVSLCVRERECARGRERERVFVKERKVVGVMERNRHSEINSE